MALIKEVAYRDFDFTFEPHPETGKLGILENDRAIKQAVKLLVMTRPYEVPYKPSFGTGIGGLLFEPMSAITADTIRSTIKTAIRNFEPRATVLAVYVKTDMDFKTVNVTVVFRTKNGTTPVKTEVMIERVG
jgi:phage baseplate assembly protein W